MRILCWILPRIYVRTSFYAFVKWHFCILCYISGSIWCFTCYEVIWICKMTQWTKGILKLILNFVRVASSQISQSILNQFTFSSRLYDVYWEQHPPVFKALNRIYVHIVQQPNKLQVHSWKIKEKRFSELRNYCFVCFIFPYFYFIFRLAQHQQLFLPLKNIHFIALRKLLTHNNDTRRF